MSIERAFDRLQANVNVDPEDLKRARQRRDLFRTALATEPDVVKVIPSGSLARGSHADPIHDVDVIVEFDAAEHPDWGAPGASAAGALQYLGETVNRLLGMTYGTIDHAVRLARPGSHAVKCFLDDPDDPEAFTVDAMPALRQARGALLVPEVSSETWIMTDPEYLIELVAKHHAEWNEFVKLVRVLKRWNRDNGAVMKSLLIEVLALECLQQADRGQALAQYFTGANVRLGYPVVDPAELCGEIQPELNVAQARSLLSAAATIAQRALDAEQRADEEAALGYWRELFGAAFPSLDQSPGGGAGRLLAGAIAASAAVASTRPRRVRDAPQG